jgi:hypothetical protein
MLAGPHVGDLPTWISAADINADGLIDLLVTNRRDRTVSVLVNRLELSPAVLGCLLAIPGGRVYLPG